MCRNTLEQVIVLSISLLKGRIKIAAESGLRRVEMEERVLVIVDNQAGTDIPTMNLILCECTPLF